MLFYRFISENLTAYLNTQERSAGDKDFDYATFPDADAEQGRAKTVKEKGFYILPSRHAPARSRGTGSDLGEVANTTAYDLETGQRRAQTALQETRRTG